MTGQGFLDRQGTGVRLGLRLFELGQLVPHQRSLRDAATPFLADLRQNTGHTVHLATLEGNDVVYTDILRGSKSPSMPSRVGGRLPAHATGVGKVILACSGSSVVRGVLGRDLERVSSRTIVNGWVLAQQFEKIRAARIGFDFEESAPGVICVASPIIDATGNVLGALSLSGWSSRMDPQRLTPIVRNAAVSLSRTLKNPSD
jgi:DNA-binding IclR family transcriptional regulator